MVYTMFSYIAFVLIIAHDPLRAHQCLFRKRYANLHTARLASQLCTLELSRVVRKPAFCICENKAADQLRGNREADQRLRFRYMDSTIPLLPKSEISRFYPSSVTVQPGLCRTWSETPKTGFLTTRLNLGRHTNTLSSMAVKHYII